MLIAVGALGIVFSPSASLARATETRSFKKQEVEQQSWGAKVVTSEIHLPWIQNSRGLYLMHFLTGASMITIFCGVHLLATVRQRG